MAAPTMDDVAAHAGVSRSLVSLVMRGSPRVSDHSREVVLAAADELGYRPNLAARTLASRRTMTIGVLLDDLHNPFYADVLDGFMSDAIECGYHVLLTTGMNRPAVQERAVDTLLQLHADGAILISPRIPVDQVETAARAMPIVTVAEPLATTLFDTVSSNEEIGARLVVEHLVGLGHRSIVHADGGSGAGAESRRRGYLHAMRAAGIADQAEVIPAEFTEAGGQTAARLLLGRRELPTAVFAANDLSALGVLDTLLDAGVRIPEDVSVVGYDNTSMAASRLVNLTSVDQPRAEMGHEAFRLLLERIDGRSSAVHRTLTPTLAARRSSAPPRIGV